MDSLIMVVKHLDTILETESDEFIKSSVENLVQNPSESEDECECDVPDCDDSQTTNFSTFSNPLFDDSTSSNDESSHEEPDSLIGQSLKEMASMHSLRNVKSLVDSNHSLSQYLSEAQQKCPTNPNSSAP
ncbi:hypothetical protein Tco_0856458 [Tanacetum coccineum]|uniref:Uncharacterized protein n=1 Tax=Tanacetum coccineum TaxID=301880 RepID=A0ABQ5B463_9ASTR